MDQSEALLARYRSCLAAYSLRSQARMRRCKPTHGLLSTPIDGWITDPPTDDEWGTATLHFRDAVERVFARRIDAVLRVQARIRAVDQKLQAKRRELQAMVFAFAQHRAPVHGASKEEGEEADDEPLASLDPALLAEFERTLAARSEYTSRVDEITLFTSIVKARVPRNDLTQELRNDRHRLSEEHAQTLDCPPEHIRIALDWDDRLLGAETTKNLQDCVVNGTDPSTFENKGGTSCIVIADGDGNAMSVVQSVFHVFGSAFMDPGTGIMMNNRMTGFRVDKNDPRNVAPRKRPSHTLNPVMVLKDGKPRYLMTTPGGPGQTLSMVQVLTNLVDRGMELTTAIEYPRWSVGLDGSFMLEDGYSEDIAAELGRRGHEVKHGSGASYFGSAKTIEVLENGVITGAADTRREAFAAGR